MIRENEKDRIVYDDVDYEFCKNDPWGDVEQGKLVGRIVIGELISTSDDVAVYRFNVESLVDDFIDSYSPFTYENPDSIEKARQIINDLRAIADKLEGKL